MHEPDGQPSIDIILKTRTSHECVKVLHVLERELCLVTKNLVRLFFIRQDIETFIVEETEVNVTRRFASMLQINHFFVKIVLVREIVFLDFIGGRTK